MNPYEPSHIPPPAREPTLPPRDLTYTSLLKVCETIFLEWERRRWIWNAVLLTLIWVGYSSIEPDSPEFRISWGPFLYVALILNLIYFGGPILEFLATWLRGRRVLWGSSLFVIGLIFYTVLLGGGIFGLWVIEHLRCSGH